MSILKDMVAPAKRVPMCKIMTIHDSLEPADQKVFLEAAKVAVVANRARVDADDAMGVTYLRGKGMTVTENLDKSKFVAALAPVYAEFEKQFGKANMDKIRNTK